MPDTTTTLIDIKKRVEEHLGRKVRLEAHKSKKKMYQKTGYIEATYPAIFTVSVESDSSSNSQTQRMSFSYIDVLTNNVKIDLIDTNGGSISL